MAEEAWNSGVFLAPPTLSDEHGKRYAAASQFPRVPTLQAPAVAYAS